MENILLNSTGASSSNLKLEGLSNWSTWKFQIKVILKALEIYDVTEGKLDKPESSTGNAAETAAWLKKDAKAQSVLVTRLSDKVMLQVMNCETSKSIWEKLHTYYEQTSETSLHLAQQKFFSMTFHPKDDIASFLSKIEENVSQIKQLGGEIPDKMVLTKIVTSLPDTYKHFISAWDSVSTDKQILSELTARLLTEEQRMTNREEVTALMSKNTGVNRKCFRCGKTGHLKKQCRVKLNKSEISCELCKKKGHLKKNCWFLKSKNENNGNDEHLQNAFSTSLICGQAVTEDWIVDSGASEHMCHDKNVFYEMEMLSEPKNIVIGDGNLIKAEGKGKIMVSAYNGEKWIETTIHNVLYVPKLTVNLFSVSAAVDKGYTVNVSSDKFNFIKNNNVQAIAVRKQKIYTMVFEVINKKAYLGKVNENLLEWHKKFAHQDINQIKSVLKRNGLEYENGEILDCISCIKGKQHKMKNKIGSRAEKPGQLIHMDLCGPMEVNSLGGSRYFLVMKDDFSKYRKVYFLKSKDETKYKIKEFIKFTKINPGYSIEKIRTDNGTEFLNNVVKQISIENGIQHETSIEYTPDQNGCVEREMRTIVEAARTVLLENNLEKKFWAEAVNTVTYVINRTGPSRVKDKTPYEIYFKRDKYDINKLKCFGSKVAVHIPDQKRRKWDSKSEIGIFLGYGENIKGYRVYLPESNIISVKRDVIFLKNSKELGNSKPENMKVEQVNQIEAVIDQQNPTNIEDVNRDDENILQENENETTTERVEEITKRTRKGPVWLNDYEVNFVSIYDDPLSYHEAMESIEKEEWSKAIKAELNNLKTNKTWTEIDEHPGKEKLISSKWVFKIKENENGEKTYKARLVARGFQQTNCDDEVYAPVVKLTTFRIFMAIANKLNLPVYQLDVVGAFLHGEINEEVFMKLPDGRLCKLNRSIYGLKKSPKYWNQKFDDFMNKENFTRSKNDLCLYERCKNNNQLYLLIYVDDILIFGNNNQEIENFKILLNNNFKTKDLGLASNFLGINIRQDLKNGTTEMNQRKYLEKVLIKFGMADCKPAETPIDQNFDFQMLNRQESENILIEQKCRQLIGSLLYAVSGTRPDITVAVNFLSRYQHCASIMLYKSLKRVLRYIKNSLNLGIVYERGKQNVLEGFVDADYASDPKDRRSTSGYIIVLYGGVVSWSSRKQTVTALSSTESEYIALSNIIVELLWIKKLLVDFGINYNKPIVIHEDNQSVIKITEKNENNKRLKHVDVKYNHILENVENKEVELKYVQSAENIADLFTKPLGKIKFEKFKNNILK